MRKLLPGRGVWLGTKPQPLSNTSTRSIDATSAVPFVIGGLALMVAVSGMLVWRVRAAGSTAARRTD
jgi:hypothetical protein